MNAAVVAKVIARHIGARSQQELAEAAGLDPNTLSRILTGETKRVTLKSVHAIANALGVPYSVFEQTEAELGA